MWKEEYSTDVHFSPWYIHQGHRMLGSLTGSDA